LDPDEIAPESTRPLSRREYEALVRLGTFEGERVELLYGTLVTMSPHGPEHDEATNDLAERLIAALGERAKVRVQSAFAASDESEPEPDLAVVPRRSYRDAHPDEAYLIVEVARSSLAKDRGIKARLYAESGVEEYWVVDLKAGAVEVHRDPRDGTYATRTRHARGDELTLARFPDLRLKVADIVS
jgi:Uma2 family endonuclease